MFGTFVLLGAIWITIALTKLMALVFVMVILAVGLGIREFTRRRLKRLAAAAPPAPELPAAVPTPVPAPSRRLPRWHTQRLSASERIS